MMEYGDLEALIINVQEARVQSYRDVAEICYIAVVGGPGAVKSAAHLLGQKAGWVRARARIYEAFGTDLLEPNVPIDLYRAAMETDDPPVWLEQAVTEAWSARQLRDAAGIARGDTVSRVVFKGQGPCEQWDVDTGTVTVSGLPLSGEKPKELATVLREVLDV